jgi:hypothetical protein
MVGMADKLGALMEEARKEGFDGRGLDGRIRMPCTVMESSSLTSARCEGRAGMTQPSGGAQHWSWR